MKTSILSVLFFSALSLAHPAKVPKRNVLIPGPGMPSVESLGLTQEDLDRIPEEWEISHHLNNTLEARQDFSCWQSLACNLNDAIQGYNFLAALQHYNCAVGSIGAQFAQVGNCQWWGFPNGGVQSASSWCIDVANGGAKVLWQCQGPGQSVAGTNTAYGNGNLLVQIATVTPV